MPDEVKVKVGSDTSGVEQGMQRSGKSVRNFADEAEAAAKKTAASYSAMQASIGKSLLGVSGAIATGFAGASKAAADVEKALRAANTMTKLNEKGFRDLTNEVFRLSDSMKGGNAKELADGLYDIYGSGIQGAKGMEVLRQANLAAGAGLVTVKEAAKPLTDVMNSYKLSADQAAYANNILFKIVDRGKLSFADLGGGLGKTLAITNAAGVSLEEYGAFMALLTKNGVPVAESQVAIARATEAILFPSKEAEKEMNRLGVAYGRQALEAKGLGGVMTDLMVKTGGNEQSIHKMIPSVEALVLALQFAKDKGADFRTELQVMADGSNAVQSAFDENAKSAAASWKEFLKEAYNATAKFGTDVLPVAKKAVELATGVVRSFEEASPEARRFAETGLLVTGVVSAIAGAFFVLSPAIASLPASLTVARGAIALTVGSIGTLAGPVTILAGTVAALYVAWEKNWLGIQKITTDVVDQVSGMITDLENRFQSIPKMFTAGLINDTQDKADRESWIQASARRGPGGGLAGLAGPNIKLSGSVVVPSSNPNLPQQIRLPKNQSVRDAADQNLANTDPSNNAVTAALSVFPKPTEFDKALDSILDSMSGVPRSIEKMIKAQEDAAKGASTWTKEEEKKRKSGPTEDELRAKMVAEARKMATAGTSTGAIAELKGLGDASSQCANTMRLISERAGMKFAIDTNPFDKGSLRPGEDVGSAHADSLFGNKVGKFKKNNPSMGDLVFFEKGGRPGVVGHVGMVSGDGNMIDASSSKQRVTERPITSTGQRILGYISPNVYGKSGKATEDEFTQLREELKKRREDFTRFVETDQQRQVREIYEAGLKALDGASTDAERSQVKAKIDDLLNEARKDQEDPMLELFKDRKALMSELLNEAVTGSKKQFDFQRGLQTKTDNPLPLLRGRLDTLDTEITGTRELGTGPDKIETEQVLQQLLLERKAIVEEIHTTETTAADEKSKKALADFAFDQQMGNLRLEDKKLWLQQELEAFTGTEEQKRTMILALHETEMQLERDKFTFADEVFQGFSQSLQGMLTQSLSSQANFGESFKSMWKSVANSILAEITKMIVKSLMLQKIMRSIFGFFGGGLAGILGIGGGAGLSIGESVAGNIPTFHSGGVVGDSLIASMRADEVLTKLQTDELVLSRDQVQSASGSSGASINNSFTINITGDTGMDPRALTRHLGYEIETRLKGVY